MSIKSDTPTKLVYTAGIGMFLSTLDSGIVNIAIPQLLSVFHVSINIVIWTVTLYTLVLSSSILLFGRLADRVGRIKIYISGLILFSFSSFLCGTANNIGLLIAYRAIQGLSAGMIQATALTLITTRLTSHHLIKAMTSLGMIIGLGPLLAPALGGLILNTVGWRWIFWLNIPVGLLGLYYCYHLNKVDEVLDTKPMPVFNLLFMAITLFLSLFTLNNLNNFSIKIFISAILTIIFFSLYFIAELNSKNTVIPLSLFKKLSFTAPIISIMAFGTATTGIFMLPPLYLQTIRGFESWQVGLICLAAPAGIVISAKLSSKLVINKGTAMPIVYGLLLMSLSLASLTMIQSAWPLVSLILPLFFYGLGGGLFQTPCYLHLTSQFQGTQHGFISSLIRMLQNVAIAFASVGFAFFIGHQAATSHGLLIGIQYGFTFSLAVMVVAVIVMIAGLAIKEPKYDFS